MQEASLPLYASKEESPDCIKQGMEGNLRRETAGVQLLKGI